MVALSYSTLSHALNTGSLNVFAEMELAVLRRFVNRFVNMPISGDSQSLQ